MVKYAWDAVKNKINLAKHGVDSEAASLVFEDPFCIAFADSIKDGEARWHAIGMVGTVSVLVVVHTYAMEGIDEVIRIISCRRALKHERKLYEENR
jgi:uncharacterized DUF497 family protein